MIGAKKRCAKKALREKVFFLKSAESGSAAAEPAAKAGIRTVQMRFGLVLSASGGALQKMLLPFRMGVGGNMGNGRQWWSWVDIDDLVGAVQHVI